MPRIDFSNSPFLLYSKKNDAPPGLWDPLADLFKKKAPIEVVPPKVETPVVISDPIQVEVPNIPLQAPENLTPIQIESPTVSNIEYFIQTDGAPLDSLESSSPILTPSLENVTVLPSMGTDEIIGNLAHDALSESIPDPEFVIAAPTVLTPIENLENLPVGFTRKNFAIFSQKTLAYLTLLAIGVAFIYFVYKKFWQQKQTKEKVIEPYITKLEYAIQTSPQKEPQDTFPPVAIIGGVVGGIICFVLGEFKKWYGSENREARDSFTSYDVPQGLCATSIVQDNQSMDLKKYIDHQLQEIQNTLNELKQKQSENHNDSRIKGLEEKFANVEEKLGALESQQIQNLQIQFQQIQQKVSVIEQSNQTRSNQNENSSQSHKNGGFDPGAQAVASESRTIEQHLMIPRFSQFVTNDDFASLRIAFEQLQEKFEAIQSEIGGEGGVSSKIQTLTQNFEEFNDQLSSFTKREEFQALVSQFQEFSTKIEAEKKTRDELQKEILDSILNNPDFLKTMKGAISSEIQTGLETISTDLQTEIPTEKIKSLQSEVEQIKESLKSTVSLSESKESTRMLIERLENLEKGGERAQAVNEVISNVQFSSQLEHLEERLRLGQESLENEVFEILKLMGTDKLELFRSLGMLRNEIAEVNRYANNLESKMNLESRFLRNSMNHGSPNSSPGKDTNVDTSSIDQIVENLRNNQGFIEMIHQLSGKEASSERSVSPGLDLSSQNSNEAIISAFKLKNSAWLKNLQDEYVEVTPLDIIKFLKDRVATPVTYDIKIDKGKYLVNASKIDALALDFTRASKVTTDARTRGGNNWALAGGLHSQAASELRNHEQTPSKNLSLTNTPQRGSKTSQSLGRSPH